MDGHSFPSRPRSLWPSEKGIPVKIGSPKRLVPDTVATQERQRLDPSNTAAVDGEPTDEKVATSPRPSNWLSTPWRGRGIWRGPRQSGDRVPHRDAVRQDPWELYEPRVRLYQGPLVTLARRRSCKAELVAVQALDGGAEVVRERVRQAQQNDHRGFPRLVDVLIHEQRHYLVWEACELSVREVMASECSVTEPEVVEIIWAVLQGIAFLRSQGRALTRLTAECILLTTTGSVKIAGADHCREISPSDEDPDILQLTALASIIDGLLGKGGHARSWSQRLRSIPGQLAERPVEELIRDPLFECMSGEGELAALVKVANMSAYRHIEFLCGPEQHCI